MFPYGLWKLKMPAVSTFYQFSLRWLLGVRLVRSNSGSRLVITTAGWWFQTCFPYIGDHHPKWLSYFSEGWLNEFSHVGSNLPAWSHVQPCIHIWCRYGWGALWATSWLKSFEAVRWKIVREPCGYWLVSVVSVLISTTPYHQSFRFCMVAEPEPWKGRHPWGTSRCLQWEQFVFQAAVRTFSPGDIGPNRRDICLSVKHGAWPEGRLQRFTIQWAAIRLSWLQAKGDSECSWVGRQTCLFSWATSLVQALGRSLESNRTFERWVT